MNNIYGLKFDKRRNAFVVVSEIATGCGKSKNTGTRDGTKKTVFRHRRVSPLLLTGFMTGLFPLMAWAADLPTGGQVVAGQASMATQGNTMTITQASRNMAATWNSFDIGKNHTVQFVQPDRGSVALNRVTGGGESRIMGSLNANGQVFLINPNGVFFGQGASVNTAGLIASTRSIDTAEFMQGRYVLSGGGTPGARVINQGALTTAQGGVIVLAADHVGNEGTLTTPAGTAVLAAADKVTLQLDDTGLASVSVAGSVVNALVANRGLISAADGRVYLTALGKERLLNTVVNNSGIVQASGLSARGGAIVLNGGDSGVVSQSGALLADSSTGRGGHITITGEHLHLAAHSSVSAAGQTGGGEVYVGGGWQGQDAAIPNASQVVMDKTARIDVRATESGDGGTAVLWSDDYTNVQGTVLASGGARSGNGGRVETSSRQNLQVFGAVDVSAPRGQSGDWLLDPTDVTIVGSGADTNVDSTTTEGVFVPTASGAQILNTTLNDSLNRGSSVTIKTSGTDTAGQTGNIAVNAAISKTAGDDATLTLLADGNIVTMEGGSWSDPDLFSSTAGKLNLEMRAGNGGRIILGKFFRASLNGGDFTAGVNKPDGGAIAVDQTNNGYIKAKNITIDALNGYTGYFNSMTAEVNLTINGGVDVSADWGTTTEFKAGEVLTINAPKGDVRFKATEKTRGGGHIALSGGQGVSINAAKGQINLAAADGELNSLNVTSSGGNISLSGNAAGMSSSKSGVYIDSTNLTAAAGQIKVVGVADGQTWNGTTSGIQLMKNVTFQSTLNSLDGKHVGNQRMSTSNHAAAAVGVGSGDITFVGSTDIKAESKFYAGFLINAGYASSINLNFRDGESSITAVNSSPHNYVSGNLGAFAIKPWGNVARPVAIDVSNGTLNINASAVGADGFSSWAGPGPGPVVREAGYKFSGDGNINIKGVSNSNNGVELRLLDNTKMTGRLTIRGESNSGSGIISKEFSNINLINADVSGVSKSGAGVSIDTMPETAKGVSLSGGTLEGSSSSGKYGVRLNGKNISVSNGSISGTVTSGSGQGVTLIGGSNFGLSKVTVTGMSAGGAGAELRGNVTLNNGSTVTGTSSSGAGIAVVDNLTLSDKSALNGTSTEGTGVILGAALKGGKVVGESERGIGLQLADNAQVTRSDLKGISTSGRGVAVTGAAVLDDTSAQTLLAQSTNGTGLSVESGANISIVHLSESEQPKKDASGNPVLDESGNPVMETVVTAAPVSAPVVLSGTSQTGSGVATSGNASIRGVTLSGTASTGGATGVTLGGNLTIADDISGISASATGQGTALHINDGQVNATGYDAADKPFVIRATAENGTAIRATGDNRLSHVELNGTASGTGSAVVVSGSLSTDQSLTATSQGDGGTGLQLDGGQLQSTAADQAPVTVTVSAVENGTAVAVTKTDEGQSDSALSGITLAASADKGTVLELAGNLITDRDISVSTENGTAISLNGGGLRSTEGTPAATVTAQATGSGTAVTVKPVAEGQPGSSLANLTLNALSAQGDALNVEGVLNTQNVTVVATATGTSRALNLNGGTLHALGGTVVAATANKGQAAVITNGTLTGDAPGALTVMASTVTDSPAVSISGTSAISNSVVSGKSSGNGNAVTVAGTVTSAEGGEINGQTVNGTAVAFADGASVTSAREGGLQIDAVATGDRGTGVTLAHATLTGSQVNAEARQGNAVTLTNGTITGGKIFGQAERGIGLNISGAAGLKDAVVSGTTQTGTGAVIRGTLTSEGTAQVTGAATQDGGGGLTLMGSVTGGNVQGQATSGEGILVAEGGTINNATVSGTATTGAGLHVKGKATLANASLTGTTQTGKGSVIEGNLTADASSSVTGTATEDGGDGVTVMGSVTGGKVQGQATSGEGIFIADGGAINNATVNGTATTGAGLHVKGNATLANASLTGTTQTGKGSLIEGSLTADASSSVTGTATEDGGDGVTVMGSVTGGKVQGQATSGEGIFIADGGAINNATVNGTATTGAGLHVKGNATLANASLTGTTQTGKGSVIEGNLTTDAGSSVTGTATQDGGDGVTVIGSLTGGKVQGQATSGEGISVAAGSAIHNADVSGTATTGTGLHINGNATLKNASLTGTTQTGKGSVIEGSLTADAGSSVTGTATQDGGDGVNVIGTITGGKVQGQATSGEGISVAAGSAINNADVSGIATTGAGLHIKGKATLENASLTGATQTGKGSVIEGSLTADAGSSVTGTATQDGGDGVNVIGTITGGKVQGQATSGEGISVAAGSAIHDAAVSGTATTGAGLHIKGNATLENASLTGTTQTGKGSIIEGSLTADAGSFVTGTATQDGGDGVNVIGSVTGGKVQGQATSGEGISVADGSAINNAGVSGTATTGAGLHIKGKATLENASLTGTTQTGKGSIIEGSLTADAGSFVTGTATQDGGDGVTLIGSVTGGKVQGQATNGQGILIADSSVIADATVTGISSSGTGINVANKLTLSDKSALNGTSAEGTGVILGAALEGGKVVGESERGAGLQLADNAQVTRSDLTGSSTSGRGVAVTGAAVLDDTSAGTLLAQSTNGTGLSVENGANISIVHLSESEQPKKDASGNPVLDESGNPVMETVVTAAPVSAPVVLSGTSQTGSGVATSGNASISGVTLNGTASTGGATGVTLGGTLTLADAIAGVSAAATGQGTALHINDGVVNATGYEAADKSLVIRATAENGTAIRATGDNRLSHVELNGTASGTGSAVVVSGSLSTDQALTATSQGDGGIGLQLDGGQLQSTAADQAPVTVTAQATGSGTAVIVKPVADGQPGSSLANLTLNARSAQGDALNVEGVLNTQAVTVVATATDTGRALNVNGGTLHALGATVMTATADKGQAAVIHNGTLTGDAPGALSVTASTATDSPALSISGTSEVSNSAVSGKSSGNGTAVTVAGTVTSAGGGEINGQTVNGTAVAFADGASVTSTRDGGLLIDAVATGAQGTGVTLAHATLTGSQINAQATQGNAVTLADGTITGGKIFGQAERGTGLNISGTTGLTDAVVSGTTQTGTGAVIRGTLTSEGTAQVTGTATQDGGDGVNVIGSVTGGNVQGQATSGEGVLVADGGAIHDATVSGTATTGAGLHIKGDATLTNASLAGTTQTGKGSVIEGSLTADAGSSVMGRAAQDGGAGVVVSGSVTGGRITGHAAGEGAGVSILDGHTTDVIVNGHSHSGAGVEITGNSSATGGVIKGTAVQGVGVTGIYHLSHDGSTHLEGSQEPPKSVLDEYRAALQSIVAASGRPGSYALSGFQAASGVMVPQRDFRQAERQANLTVCQGVQCRSTALDVNGPRKERAHP